MDPTHKEDLRGLLMGELAVFSPRSLTLTVPSNRLYVGSLNFALTENDIRQVFQPFGPVEVVDLHKDPVTGKSKGYAFVQCVTRSSFS